MRLIVDGNNVMGNRPDGWWRDRAGAAQRLAEQIAAWAAGRAERVTVVFDGARPPGWAEHAPLEVLFADRRGPNAADAVIAELVERDADPAQVTVVTSDAALAARVRAAGARVTGARGFRALLDGGHRA